MTNITVIPLQEIYICSAWSISSMWQGTLIETSRHFSSMRGSICLMSVLIQFNPSQLWRSRPPSLVFITIQFKDSGRWKAFIHEGRDIFKGRKGSICSLNWSLNLKSINIFFSTASAPHGGYGKRIFYCKCRSKIEWKWWLHFFVAINFIPVIYWHPMCRRYIHIYMTAWCG